MGSVFQSVSHYAYKHNDRIRRFFSANLSSAVTPNRRLYEWLARIMKVDITIPDLRSMKIIKSCDAQVIIPPHKTTVVSSVGDTWQIKPWNRNKNEYENSRYY
ncbi:MAG TPA: hypothetical protein VIJ25_14985 [Methylococcales bacterium]